MTQEVFFVNDHEDNRSYQFYSEGSAIRWRDELVEVFETDRENISVIARTYDRFGNWISQRYI